MSANTIVDYTAADVVLRYQMLDNEVLNSFERASNLSQYSQEQLASATQWVILADLGANLADEIQAGGFTLDGATGIIPGSFYVTPGDGRLELMIDALRSSTDIDYFYPLIEFNAQQNAVPNDPYLTFQWHLINYGQLVGGLDGSFIRGVPDEDINIEGAWDLATGKGIQIGIVDSGVQMNHPDLEGNIRADLAISFVGGAIPANAHGTAVAGLAAGVGNNGIGITGVAYEADIVPIKLFTGDPLTSFVNDATVAQSLIYQFQTIDVYNHSWGLLPANPRQMIDLGPLSLTALRNSVFFGRGGKGSIHVVASGNGGAGTSSQYDGFANTRYTITVTAVDHDGIGPNADGTVTTYPEGGANVLVAAPSGSVALEIIRDTLLGSGIYTTDFINNGGYNRGPDVNGLETDNDYFPDTNYTSRFSGTSAAAPIVSGVIALMLEVNPNLTYRDVQHILVRAARQTNPSDPSWQVNAREFQLDPLPPVPLGGDEDPFFDPQSDWPGNPVYYIDQLPAQFENGAGFTVSQTFGSYRDGGYAHGVVDASVAVLLAKNWRTVGNQASEFNWTTGPTLAGKIWAREVSSDETGERLIPGGLAGDGDSTKEFGDYYNEFGEDESFVDEEGNLKDDLPIPDRDLGYLINGQAGIPILPPSMTVEWIEVRLNLGATPEDINQLRIALVSPDGTVSELIGSGQTINRTTDHFDGNDSFGPTDTLGRTNNLIFSTNRHWGERTEPKVRTDSTGTPILNSLGEEIIDGWRLVFENYSDTDIDIQNYEVVFHGINTANTGRVQGTIGIDENADGFFSGTDDFTHGPNDDRESFAAGVIVYVDANQNGVRDSTELFYQTGNDGNYYFDIPVGTYDIRIDGANLPKGLDNVQNMAFAANAPISTITVTVGQRVTPFNTPTPEAQALNVTLMPNVSSTATTFDVSGFIVADLDRDGVQDPTDGAVAGAEVFLDVNQNGVYDPIIDRVTFAAADGSYSFVGVEAPKGFYTVFVVEGTTGAFVVPTFPLPANGTRSFFATPGDTITNVNIGLASIPDPNEGQIDPNTPGAVSGVIFLDANNTGANEGEPGAAGVVVYIDANGDNTLNAGETTVVTGVNGTYTFNNLAPFATYSIRIVTPDGYARTAPAGGEHNVFLLTAQVVSGLNFGIRNLATNDYGDLPSSFGGGSAYHPTGSPFFLGASVDGELAANPSEGADGDDTNGMDDEDGVIFPGNGQPGALGLSSTWSFQVTANTTGGYLTAWADFNGNGTFEASERLTLKSGVIPSGTQKMLLQAGVNELFVDVPAAALASNSTGFVYIRFRYGEIDINDFFSPALKGEVEDYRVPIFTVDPGVQIIHGPDFNEDGKVDGRDFLIWQRGFGKTSNVTFADGDANSDGRVDHKDLAMWQDQYGTSSGNLGALAALGSSETSGIDPVVYQQLVTSYLDKARLFNDWLISTSIDVDSIEVSAGESTFGLAHARQLAGVAGYADLLFGLHAGLPEEVELVEDEIEEVFAGFDEESATSLGASYRTTSGGFLVESGSEDEADEENAFELAFALEADWLQF